MKRRLATLATIMRLDDQRIKTHAAELVVLQERAASIAQEASELDRRRQTESSVTTIEAMPYLGYFLATLRGEYARLNAERRAVEQAVDAKRDEVLAAWRDYTSKDHLQQAIYVAARQKRAATEQGEMDERTIQSHVRQSLVNRRPIVQV